MEAGDMVEPAGNDGKVLLASPRHLVHDGQNDA